MFDIMKDIMQFRRVMDRLPLNPADLSQAEKQVTWFQEPLMELINKLFYLKHSVAYIEHQNKITAD